MEEKNEDKQKQKTLQDYKMGSCEENKPNKYAKGQHPKNNFAEMLTVRLPSLFSQQKNALFWISENSPAWCSPWK